MSKEIRAKGIKELLEETIEDVTNTAKGVVEVEGAELSTGLINLDEVLGGLWPGELVCIAGTSRADPGRLRQGACRGLRHEADRRGIRARCGLSCGPD